MTRYVTGDHHFDHANIIEYCDRPFNDVNEMNQAMQDNWGAAVDADDVVYYLGDIAMADHDRIVNLTQSLSGQFVYLLGNHDDDLEPDSAPFPTAETVTIQHDGYRFLLTHRPETVPDEWNHFIIHGHHHNNHPTEHPFFRADTKAFNVSVELTDYTPVPVTNLVRVIKQSNRGDKYTTLNDV